jgi:protein phosphatase 2C family protein 2/3
MGTTGKLLNLKKVSDSPSIENSTISFLKDLVEVNTQHLSEDPVVKDLKINVKKCLVQQSDAFEMKRKDQNRQANNINSDLVYPVVKGVDVRTKTPVRRPSIVNPSDNDARPTKSPVPEKKKFDISQSNIEFPKEVGKPKGQSEETIRKAVGLFMDLGSSRKKVVTKFGDEDEEDTIQVSNIEKSTLPATSNKTKSQVKPKARNLSLIEPPKFKSTVVQKTTEGKKSIKNISLSNRLVEKNILEQGTALIEYIQDSLAEIPPVFTAPVEMHKQSSIFAVSSNTHQGKVRDYNEDRVSITANLGEYVRRTKNKLSTANLSQFESFGIFSVFDGHGSIHCSQFLSEKVHSLLIDKLYPDFSRLEKLTKGIYEEIDNEFKKALEKNDRKYSGSCACTAIVINKTIYGINLGDSRAILSYQNGTLIKVLTQDQKPSKQEEFDRIIKAGGKIYRTIWHTRKRENFDQKMATYEDLKVTEASTRKMKEIDVGPWRINPGGLSVSRCFGDFESKCPELGGTKGVLICEPIITQLSLVDADFMVIGCFLIS